MVQVIMLVSLMCCYVGWRIQMPAFGANNDIGGDIGGGG